MRVGEDLDGSRRALPRQAPSKQGFYIDEILRDIGNLDGHGSGRGNETDN